MPDNHVSVNTSVRARMRSAILSLVVGAVLCGIKMYAWVITGSSAVMSDALESVINVITGMMVLAVLRVSARPADDTHPYGHGKIEFFSSGVEGAMILLAGGAIIVHSVNALLFGIDIRDMSVGLGLVTLAGLVNLILGLYLIRSGKKNHSEALIANGHHVLSDAWTSLAIIVGIGMVIITGIEWLDPVFALLAGAWIFWSGFGIVKKSVGLLLDAADPQLLSQIAGVLSRSRRDGWIVPHRLRAWRSGATIRVDLHLIMPFFWTLEQTHEEEHALHDAMKTEFQEPVEVIVHTEPCFPDCCRICALQGCPHRTEKAEELLEWTAILLEGELVKQTDGKGHPARKSTAMKSDTTSGSASLTS